MTPNHKVIVWAVWKENYARIQNICDGLNIKSTQLHGERTPKEKDEAVEQFTKDPETRVLIGHPGAGGIGVNLVEASYAIFYSRNFSLEQSLQAEARNYRGGSEIHTKITRVDLVCEETIEPTIMKKLASKLEVGESVLRDIVFVEEKK